MLSDYNSKKGREHQRQRFDWICGACRQQLSSGLAPHPASREPPTVIDDDDDDIEIVEEPSSTTRGTVGGKTPQHRIVSQRAEGVSSSGPSSSRKALAPPKPAQQPEIINLSDDDDLGPIQASVATTAKHPEIITLSDDDDLEPIQVPVAITSRRRRPERSLAKGQDAVPHKDNSPSQHTLPRTGAARAEEIVAPQGSSSKNTARPSIYPIVMMEPSTTPEGLGDVGNIARSNQSSIPASPRSVSLSASFLAGLSELSVANKRVAAIDAAPNVSNPPQFLYEWIVAKTDQVELAGKARTSSSITSRRPRKAINTRHTTTMGAEHPLNFSVDSWKRGNLDDPRHG